MLASSLHLLLALAHREPAYVGWLRSDPSQSLPLSLGVLWGQAGAVKGRRVRAADHLSMWLEELGLVPLGCQLVRARGHGQVVGAALWCL